MQMSVRGTIHQSEIHGALVQKDHIFRTCLRSDVNDLHGLSHPLAAL